MRFQKVTGKLGNMRRATDWVVYPRDADANPDEKTVLIQCERRIALVELDTGKAIVSDGKGGHQGFLKLNPVLGAKRCEVPVDMLETLRALKVHVGPINLFD